MKRSFSYIGVVVAIIIAFGGNAWGETLQEAVKYMIETNPDIKAASYNRLARDQQVVQAKGGYYPTIDLSYSSGIDFQTDYPYEKNQKARPKSAVASLRQNLYQFGATDNEVNRVEATVRSQAYLIQGTAESLSLRGTQVYLNVLRAFELHELAKENLLNHERIHDQMQLRSASGVDRKADLDQVSARLALARANVVVTQTNLEDAKTDYLAVIGHYPEALMPPEPIDLGIPKSVEEAERLALQDYPIVKSAQADLEARMAQYEVAKRINYPRLDVALDYKNETDVSYRYQTEDFIATAIVSYNLFNGFRNQGRIEETLQAVNEAKEILNSTQRQTVQAIRLSWDAYTNAQDRVTRLDEYVKATGLTADAFSQQWNIGRRTMFDVLDIQAEYINAKSDLVRAQYDKEYAGYRVTAGIGKLVKTLDLKWPKESVLAASAK